MDLKKSERRDEVRAGLVWYGRHIPVAGARNVNEAALGYLRHPGICLGLFPGVALMAFAYPALPAAIPPGYGH